MSKVEFYEEDSCFLLSIGEEEVGVDSIPFHYIPDHKNILPNLKDESFDIVLLNNPFLHKEVNWYKVCFDGSEERGGFVFPISLLESEEVNDKYLLSYMFVAYRKLLLMMGGEPTGVLSDSYSDAFVLVVHKETKTNFVFEEYVLSLAHYGFYDYQGPIGTAYPKLDCIENQPKTIRLWMSNTNNLMNGYVKELVFNRLCSTTDFLTRFVLVYQIVELYIAEIHHGLLEDRIVRYKNDELTRNDFSEELKEISKEKYQIEQLVDGITNEDISNKYRDEVCGLFNDVGCVIKTKSLCVLLYAFRNHLFHNYGVFDGKEDALNQVIFSFERVILLLLSKRPIKT